MNSKQHKVSNLFRDIREAQHLTREKAAELSVFMSPSKIEHIETGVTEPRPDEVLCLARCYNSPELINYFCCEMCAIGREVAPKAIHQNPPEIIINLLSASDKLISIKSELIRKASQTSDLIESAELYIDLQKILKEIGSCNASLYIWINKQKSK